MARIIKKLGSQTMNITCQERCFKLTTNTYEEVHILTTTCQEGADTRLFVHAQHAAQTHRSLVILAKDTNVLVIGLNLSSLINCNLYIRHGSKSRVRMINIWEMKCVYYYMDFTHRLDVTVLVHLPTKER